MTKWQYVNIKKVKAAIARAATLSDLDRIVSYFVVNSPGISNLAKAAEFDAAARLVDKAANAPRFEEARKARAQEKFAIMMGASHLAIS